MEINGKIYPMWGQFVEKKEEWIGGKLIDIDSVMGEFGPTEISDITLEPNGDDSARISFKGKDFDCSSDVGYIGVGAPYESHPDYLAFYTPFGNTFLIKKRESNG